MNKKDFHSKLTEMEFTLKYLHELIEYENKNEIIKKIDELIDLSRDLLSLIY